MLLAWVTFAAGGVYAWVWIPAGCATVALAVMVKPRVAADAPGCRFDVLLVVLALALCAQLVPMPAGVLMRIDPNALTLRQTLWIAPPGIERAALPVSILPGDTAAALGIFVSALLAFWACRRMCEEGETGRIVRAISVFGILASMAAIIQRAQSQELLYGVWRPGDAGARPFGPFVNRNHFATWAIMACPLVFGYLVARAPAEPAGRGLRHRIVAAARHLGSIRVWLAVSVALMVLAVFLSTSRSGLIGLCTTLGVGMLLARRRHHPQARQWMVFQVASVIAVVLGFANLGALTTRFDDALAPVARERGRRAIWEDTGRIINDFRLTGTGAGTYNVAINAYQKSEPGYSIGQAHNHYLQIAADGGLLVGIPAAAVLAAFALVARRRLIEDASSNFLVRAGAFAGIGGVLVQIFGERGLRMPANAMLCAVLAGIAVHAPRVMAPEPFSD